VISLENLLQIYNCYMNS